MQRAEQKVVQRVEQKVADQPSAFRLILPEAQLSDGHTEEHIARINETMLDYQKEGVFKEYPDAMIYLERVQSDGRVRCGVIGKIDLEEYDYSKGSTTPVRATEATVPERIPPRLKIRNGDFASHVSGRTVNFGWIFAGITTTADWYSWAVIINYEFTTSKPSVSIEPALVPIASWVNVKL